LSFPKEFINSLPFNQENKFKLINGLQKEPVISVRKNPFKENNLFKKEDQVTWSKNGRYLKERPSFISDPLFHAGTYYSQEASSMFLEMVLKSLDFSGKVILDLCAAPGGKSTLINSCLPKNSLLVANEVIKSRSWILKENLDKWGSSNVIVTNNDPLDFEKFLGFFDAVLVDAPCSGEGMFRKDKNAINEWSERNVSLCSDRQKRILADIIPTITNGGVLIYSTCTFNEKENRDNLKWLQENYEVENLVFEYPDNEGIIEMNEDVLKGYQFLPGITKGEGFFLSAMRIYGGREKFKVPKRIRKLRLNDWDSSRASFLNNENENYVINEMIHNFPGQFKDILKSIIWDLNPIKIGCQIGQEMKGKIKYSHELAFSNELNKAVFELVEVSKEEAIKYLQKRDLLEVPNIKSWGLITFRNQPLGWIKKVGNRVNNYYPKEFRIRKEFFK
jgi:16S rRNA C967 or C1407 C5-methylase (RsmB/RsmF family)/NOL1/NOP2/fmu family ribosome biogenesis protein